LTFKSCIYNLERNQNSFKNKNCPKKEKEGGLGREPLDFA
jgi:hypothetical protein